MSKIRRLKFVLEGRSKHTPSVFASSMPIVKSDDPNARNLPSGLRTAN